MPVRLHLEEQSFGEWTVHRYLGSSTWECRCSCGAVRNIKTGDLRSGATRSCGCIHEGTPKSFKIIHGGVGTAEYRVWKHMKGRCEDTNDKAYKNYGGRGISVCERWRSNFPAFLADVGPRPSAKHSVERLDVNGNYEPGNVIWLVMAAQARNTRRTSFVEYRGQKRKLVDLSDELGIPADTLHKRALRGSYGFRYV